MSQTNQRNLTIDRVTQSIVLVYQALAVIVFILSLFFAYDWLKNPFIGGFFEQTLVLNGSDTREAGKHWALYEAGFELGDQLISVAGHPISNSNDLRKCSAIIAVGKPLPVVMRSLRWGGKHSQCSFHAVPGC